MKTKYFSTLPACTMLIILCAGLFITACSSIPTYNPASNTETATLEHITLPEGFIIQEFATNVPNARAMTLAPDGTIFVGTRNDGRVYAIKDTNNDFAVDELYVVAEDLNMPAGVVYHKGDLYVSATSRILKYENILEQLNQGKNAPQLIDDPIVIYDEFPDDKHHGWKFIDIGPDNKLYVPVGAPCNLCEEEDPYATITRMNLDGSELEIIAQGVRNSVGFAWHPQTKELWFTENGRDLMGDNMPPDELNKIDSSAETAPHFGYPYCHGKNIEDDKYTERNCEEFIPAAVELGPHVAALGMLFYTGTQFPKEYTNKILIAEHGSWNRKEPIGYRITIVDPEQQTYKPFAEGWLQGEETTGRPADVLQYTDGSVLVSDDSAGKIYRISYVG